MLGRVCAADRLSQPRPERGGLQNPFITRGPAPPWEFGELVRKPIHRLLQDRPKELRTRPRTGGRGERGAGWPQAQFKGA